MTLRKRIEKVLASKKLRGVTAWDVTMKPWYCAAALEVGNCRRKVRHPKDRCWQHSYIRTKW